MCDYCRLNSICPCCGQRSAFVVTHPNPNATPSIIGQINRGEVYAFAPSLREERERAYDLLDCGVSK